MAKKRRLLLPIQFTFGGVEVQGADGEPRKFSTLAYTGGPLRVDRYPLPVVIDLAGLEFAESVVVNVDHDPKQRVGHVTETENDGKQIVLAGVISSTSGHADEVVESAKNGFPWKSSVEAIPTAALEEVKAGRTVTVNGQVHTGPLLVARKARLRGVAFLSRPADENTSVSIAASAAQSYGAEDMELKEWIEAAGFDAEDLNDKQREHLQKCFDAEVKAAEKLAEKEGKEIEAAKVDPPKFDIDELKASYAKHEAEIEKIAFKYKGEVEPHKLAELKAAALSEAVELKASAIEKEWSPLQFDVQAIDAARKLELGIVRETRADSPAIHAREKDMGPEVLGAAVAIQGNLSEVDKHFSDKALEAAHREFPRGISLQELLLAGARQNGYTGGSVRSNLRDVIQAAFSTNAIPGILSNNANKFLLEGYMHVDQAWSQISSTRPVTDFKTITSYRMTGSFQFEEVGPTGELTHDATDELSYTNKAETYGRMFAVSRQDIINDDLGALTAVPRRIGRGAALKLNDVFWTEFLDNSAFFTAGNSNYFEGGATNLQSSSLETAVEKFWKQTDADSKPLGIMPKLLVVPPEEAVTADELYVSTNINTGGAASTAKVPNRNVFAGKYQPVVSPYLSNSSYTGYSATAWYLLADPMDLSTIEVVFLNGMQAPTVESADADFNVLGIQMRGYFDFGVSKQDYRAGVKSKGAA